MLIALAWIILIVSSVAATGLLLFLVHRLCIRLEEKGLLYYRKRPQGSMSAVFQDVDRLTRPSIEHVEEFRNEARVMADETKSGD